jgi:hypothetical protein
MNWAWQQRLSPSQKLILMALADAANDFDVCWPSVSTVANKCCVSIRTVWRVMQKLVDRGLLLSEPRYRKDGSCSSNRYRLQLDRGDKLSLAPDSRDTTPGQRCEGPPDAGDIPGTTIGNQKESPLPQGAATEADVGKSAASGGGELFELEYPRALSASEREEAGRKLAGIPADTAQQLLDELAARIAANGIQATPLAYLRGLITRARAGTFTPEGALRVAEHRKCRAEVDAAVRRNEARYHDCPPVAVDTDNPLIKKLLRMQSRSREKGCDPNSSCGESNA